MREVYLYQTVHVLDGECLCLREHLDVLDHWSRTLFGCPGPQDAREVGTAVAAVADEHDLPVENLLAPDIVRRLAWDPPDPANPPAVAAELRGYGARAWQVGLTADAIAGALARVRSAGGA